MATREPGGRAATVCGPLALALALAWAAGCSDVRAERARLAGQTLAQCRALAERTCQRHLDCGHFGEDERAACLEAADVEGCVPLAMEVVKGYGAVEDGGLAQCQARLDATACHDLHAGPPCAWRSLTAPRLPDGPCRDDSDCREQFCTNALGTATQPDGGRCRVCGALRATGEPCLDGRDCATGACVAKCDADGPCTQLCRQPFGGACQTDGDCPLQSVCAEAHGARACLGVVDASAACSQYAPQLVTHTCTDLDGGWFYRPRVPTGQPCRWSEDCISGECFSGACRERPPARPSTERPPAGSLWAYEPCAHTGECGLGLSCLAQLCVRTPAEGAPCAVVGGTGPNGFCGYGLGCDAQGLCQPLAWPYCVERCDLPAVCRGGGCVHAASPDCAPSSCPPGFFCRRGETTGACVAVKGPGDGCAAPSECAADLWCLGGVCRYSDTCAAR